ASTRRGRETARPSGAASCSVSWASALEVPEAVGQVVFDGRASAFPSAGAYSAEVAGPCGERRIQALPVRSRGQPARCRLALSGPGLVPGSRRPLAGPVGQVTPNGLVARLAGAAGERIVFLYRTQP